MVSQGVEDQFELSSGGGDHSDVAAAPLAHLIADAADHAGVGQDLDGLDRGPANQPGILFGDPTAVHVLVGLVVLGCQSGPAGQEAVHAPDLGDEHCSQDRTDPRDGLHRPNPGIQDEPGSYCPANASIPKSKTVMILRSESILAAYGAGSLSRSSKCVPARPNRSVIDTWIPHFASTAWICVLQMLRSPTSLARCRTSSRNSRVAGGAIHASGSRHPQRSARSWASRGSSQLRV